MCRHELSPLPRGVFSKNGISQNLFGQKNFWSQNPQVECEFSNKYVRNIKTEIHVLLAPIILTERFIFTPL